jgi:hypothetical protein
MSDFARKIKSNAPEALVDVGRGSACREQCEPWVWPAHVRAPPTVWKVSKKWCGLLPSKRQESALAAGLWVGGNCADRNSEGLHADRPSPDAGRRWSVRRVKPGVSRKIAETSDIIEVSDGREALDLLRRELPNPVLLDVDMPGLGGLAVVKTIRSNVLPPLLPQNDVYLRNRGRSARRRGVTQRPSFGFGGKSARQISSNQHTRWQRSCTS